MAADCVDVGFGRCSLWGCWDTGGKELADEIDVRVLAVRKGLSVSVLAVADVMLIWKSVGLATRQRVADALGIAPDNVGIMATQNHGAPMIGEFEWMRTDAFADAFVAGAKAAVSALRPAEMARVAVTPSVPLTFCRRRSLADLGAFTYWFGLDTVSCAPEMSCSHILADNLRQLDNGEPTLQRYWILDDDRAIPPVGRTPLAVPEPAIMPAASDPLIQGLFFRGLNGEPIGSVLRCASHPTICNRWGSNIMSGGYPVYFRRAVEAAWGGTGLFGGGPCGDQLSAVGAKSVAAAEAFGLKLAVHILPELSTATWSTIAGIAVMSPDFDFRVRADMPESVEAAQAELETLPGAIAKASTLAEAKQLAERYEVVGYVATGEYYNWSGFELAGRAGDRIRCPGYLLRIGDAVIAGLPCEGFGAISARIRDTTIGDAIITAEQTNGFLSYIPTADEYALGGYEACAAFFDPDSADMIVETVNRSLGAVSLT